MTKDSKFGYSGRLGNFRDAERAMERAPKTGSYRITNGDVSEVVPYKEVAQEISRLELWGTSIRIEGPIPEGTD